MRQRQEMAMKGTSWMKQTQSTLWTSTIGLFPAVEVEKRKNQTQISLALYSLKANSRHFFHFHQWCLSTRWRSEEGHPLQRRAAVGRDRRAVSEQIGCCTADFLWAVPRSPNDHLQCWHWHTGRFVSSPLRRGGRDPNKQPHMQPATSWVLRVIFFRCLSKGIC